MHTPKDYLRRVCRGCSQTNRDTKKRADRSVEKARLTYARHALQFIRSGIIKTKADLGRLFGWDVQQMAHDIKHDFGNGCPYCHRKFASMGHGLRDITLDIVNPGLQSYYTTNVRWVCNTCNTEKQRLSPDNWGALRQSWERWKRDQAERKPSVVFVQVDLFAVAV
jgi:hypothetical protein